MTRAIETPAALGYRMPAEWAAHERCWMAWPCRRGVWGNGLAAAHEASAAVARAVAEFEPVTMIARSEDVAGAAALCGGAVDLMTMPIDDSWMRDTGPTFVVDDRGGVAGCNWRFNAWGKKFDRYENDAALAGRLLDGVGIRRFDAPFILEGGAFHCDGDGTAIVTESVLLNANRATATNRTGVEQRLGDWLGVIKVIWLPDGLAQDETDGHVDNVACFVAPGRVLAAIAPDPNDPNHQVLQRNADILRTATDARGRKLELVAVEQATRFDAAGRPTASSYINFYLANGGIVMPAFADDADHSAAETIAAAFPDRRLAQVDARAIVAGGGGIHCITQQQPRAGCDR